MTGLIILGVPLGDLSFGQPAEEQGREMPPTNADERARLQVLEIDQLRAEAMIEPDLPTLDRITAEDYTHVESSGKARSKAEFLDGLRRGEYRFVTFVIDENLVRVYGDVAVVTGRYHNDIITQQGRQPTKFARHIRVYVRRAGAWLNVAHQATE